MVLSRPLSGAYRVTTRPLTFQCLSGYAPAPAEACGRDLAGRPTLGTWTGPDGVPVTVCIMGRGGPCTSCYYSDRATYDQIATGAGGLFAVQIEDRLAGDYPIDYKLAESLTI